MRLGNRENGSASEERNDLKRKEGIKTRRKCEREL